jgi:hypothetical protein
MNSNLTKSAILSDCKQYRYSLERIWDESKPKVLFIMLNPSKADADIDDRTINKCIKFAKSWEFGGLIVGNLFAYRATDKYELLKIEDPIGAKNQKHLDEMISKSESVICAWGNIDILRKVGKKLKPSYEPFNNNSEKFYFIELSIYGIPKHPLYLKLKPEFVPKKLETSQLNISLSFLIAGNF